jgi:hypothetical protein
MGAAEDFFKLFLKQYPQANSGQLSIGELNKLIAEFQSKINREPDDDFDGLNPAQMHVLLYDPLSTGCLLQLNSSIHEYIQQVPLFQLAELLITQIRNAGKLKLTVKGNLPVSVCEILLNQQLISWEYMQYMPRIKEDEIPYLWPLKQYLLDQGIIKKQANTLSLTQNGEKFMKQDATERFKNLLFFFSKRFHWGNFYNLQDGGKCGQLGWAYSLLLLQKYGNIQRDSEFYSQKLINAFEKDLKDSKEQNERISQYHQAYAVRFFECFANWFGLVSIERKRNLQISHLNHVLVTKSPLLDHLLATTKSV